MPRAPRSPAKQPSLQTQIERRSRRPLPEPEPEISDEPIDPSEFVSSGSTLLNLALTDHPDCGWQLGKMANIIGDSGAGKTLLVLTTLAEVANNSAQNDIDLILDDAEHALEFNLSKVFGNKTEERVEILEPASENIEQFSDNLSVVMKRKNPFVYVLDSFDAIGSEDDTKHIETERKIRMGESKKESKGSYGMAKPKLASQMLREDCGTLKNSKGSLLIISQTRDNLTPGSFEKKTRSGGRALKFYATHEVWVILVGTINSNTTPKRRLGSECDIRVTKNKVTGKRRTVSFDIYDGYGIDDIGSMIDFMLGEKAWTGGGAKAIDTKGDICIEPMVRTKLIEFIEKHNLERKLKDAVAEVWHDVEESLKPNRKHKYE